ncbi:hypothetical protein [Caulobacter sp. NIBR1757]|uniref:hypothetical protein n=1 Tax=Caulobacter sp. NIBR1757 TaxID=3016000 RepID=UPI0022EFEA34|nr:hypothetical protein [Caulobacter sp. NIBR1757]
MDWLGPRRDIVRSTLTPQACAKDLSMGLDGTLGLFGGKPVIGQVSSQGGWLRKRIWYRNSFQTVMRLSIQETAGGSRILARSSMPIFATLFMAFWFGFIGLVTLGTLGAHGAGPSGLPDLLFILAFGVGLVAFCRWLARDEHDFLLAFIRNQVDGEIESPADARSSPPIVS